MLLFRPLIDSATLISTCKAFQSLGTLTSKCSGTSCLKPNSSLHQKAGIRCLLILHVFIFTTFHSFEATVGRVKSGSGDLKIESYFSLFFWEKAGGDNDGEKFFNMKLYA